MKESHSDDKFDLFWLVSIGLIRSEFLLYCIFHRADDWVILASFEYVWIFFWSLMSYE